MTSCKLSALMEGLSGLQIRKPKADRACPRSRLTRQGSAWGSEDLGAERRRASAQESSVPNHRREQPPASGASATAVVTA